MENRNVEIARKKARNLRGNNHQALWAQKNTNSAFFARSDHHTPPTFPPDIKPERRKLSVDMSSVLIIADNLPKLLTAPKPDTKARSTKKPGTKRKATATKTRNSATRTKISKKQSAKTPRAKKAAKHIAVAEPQVLHAETGVPKSTTVLNAQTAAQTPSPPPTKLLQNEPEPPLPRAQAVTIYRKNGLLDLLGYWMRRRATDIAKLLKPRPKRVKVPPHFAQILAENASLRKEIDRLRALQAG